MFKRNFFLSAAIGSLILFSGCNDTSKQQAPRQAPPLHVNVITAQNKNIPIWMQYTASTQASNTQDVQARVSGRLEKINFKDGELVKKGDILFEIEQDTYKAHLASAKAQKRRDIATLNLAISDIKRYEPLVRDGLAPQITLDQYYSKRDELKATIQDDQAQIDRALIELGYTKIEAPISGKVSNRLVDVGNLVGYDGPTKLTTINQIDPLYTYFSPSAQEVQIMNKYKESQKMPTFIEVKNSSEYLKRGRLYGYVDFENNTVDPLTSTVNMRATLKNDKNEYWAGTFVYINVFVTDKKKFIMLPPDVIFESQLGKYVYVVDENSTANRVVVKTGYTSRFYTQIIDGLKDGDKVVVNAFMKLKDKIKVVPNDVTATQGIDAIIANNNLIPDVNTTK